MTRSSLPKRGVCAFSILLVLSVSCAHESGGLRETAPQSAKGQRLDLGVRLSDGQWVELADLRGTPVLVFVFATFDAVSQASLTPLRPFVPQHPEIVVVGIAEGGEDDGGPGAAHVLFMDEGEWIMKEFHRSSALLHFPNRTRRRVRRSPPEGLRSRPPNAHRTC